LALDIPPHSTISWELAQFQRLPVLACAGLVLATIKNWNAAPGRGGEFDRLAGEASEADRETDFVLQLKRSILPPSVEFDLAREFVLWMRYHYGVREWAGGDFKTE